MKKIITYISILLTALVLSTNTTKAQNANNSTEYIQPFTFSSFKDYPQNKRIAYFNINGIKNKNERLYVEHELRKHTDIPRFYIYTKENNLNRCMIETKSSMDETIIISLINDIVSDYRLLKE